MAMFYPSSAASGAFSGLLAAGIAQMRGLGGYEGWRWIFILEGILSVLLGASCFFLLPDSPTRSKWLTREETKFLELSHIAYRGVKTSNKTTDAPPQKENQLAHYQTSRHRLATLPSKASSSGPTACPTTASNSPCRLLSATWAYPTVLCHGVYIACIGFISYHSGE
ncbi:Putative MFS transporter superfamily [Septoria linicola]|uniref:MFS transporter superfamily n=1 Tax=Septoria linicola TaxID=215465 RepID=A0A9Q9AVR9_9PEZI|nr:Putative MFS transporter superfamily [Septoria linicola]